MAGRKTKLTRDLIDEIVQYVRNGAYAWVAAGAVGIHKSTFHRWMKRGEEATRGIHYEFFQAVYQARAQARVVAEIEVRRDSPEKWLRWGPGRERKGELGWTDRKEIVGEDGGPLNVRFVLDDPHATYDDDYADADEDEMTDE